MGELGKPLPEKLDQKIFLKNEGQNAACEQKTTSEKAYFKIRVKKFHALKPLAFSLHFLFRRD